MPIDPKLKTHPLYQAYVEFEAADVAYRRMCARPMGDFDEYEASWRELLGRIERVWSKTEAAVSHLPGWQKVKSEIAQLRRTDPLLQYIQQARHVDEHSISALATEWDADLKGVVNPDGKLQLTWQPWDRPLLPVVNRGVTYLPPTTHLGSSISELFGQGKAQPRVIGELALRFYVNMLNRVSTEVVRPSRS